MSTGIVNVIIIILFMAVFYFLLIRPQQVRQKDRAALIDSLSVGDKIITIGGIVGVVKSLNEKTIMLQTGKDVNIELSRSSVASKLEE